MTNKTNNFPILPKLPRGMGTYDYTANGSIRYRKTITENNLSERISVTGSSISEVNKLMKLEEESIRKKIRADIKDEKTKLFQEAMNDWLFLYKQSEVIERTYDRIESTYLTHIVGSSLGEMQEQAIKSDHIQEFMNNLKNHKTNQELSYSSKKKVYELLSQYFKYKYVREPYLNPMLTVTKPKESASNVKDEELVIWNDNEIKEICVEAAKHLREGVDGYRHGLAIIFVMWIFCRIGEAQALQWKNIDIDNEIVTINKSYSRVKIRDGVKAGSYQYKIVKTKNKQSRSFKMCKMALDAIKEYKSIKKPQSEEEFVLTGKSGQILTTTSITRMYKNIINNTKNINHNKNVTIHGLRHTGISYFLRHGIPVEVVSRMAGHQSIQITIDTYYSVIEEQKLQAVDMINENARINFLGDYTNET